MFITQTYALAKKNMCMQDVSRGIRAVLGAPVQRGKKKNGRETGIFLGTTFSNFDVRRTNAHKYFTEGVRLINPADFPLCLLSYLGGYFSIEFGIQGANSTFSSGVSSGYDAFSSALSFVARGISHEAVVVELGEKITRDRSSRLTGMVCVLLKNKIAQSPAGPYVRIRSLESFFEHRGSSYGLCVAIQRVLQKAVQSGCRPHIVFASAPECSARGKRERRAICRYLPELSGCIRWGSVSDCGLSPLIAIKDSAGRFARGRGDHKTIALFVAVGENSNSSCMIVEARR